MKGTSVFLNTIGGDFRLLFNRIFDGMMWRIFVADV